MTALRTAIIVSFLLAAQGLVAGPLNVSILGSSIRINGVELRTGPRVGAGHYISLDAVEKVLGQAQDTYVAGLGVRVYAWPRSGIQVQRGFRGSDKGKIFKFQLWLTATQGKNEGKSSGKFTGHLRVEGLEPTPGTSFSAIRAQLQKAGFQIDEQPDISSAKKGSITIFSQRTKKIERVEVWCT